MRRRIEGGSIGQAGKIAKERHALKGGLKLLQEETPEEPGAAVG
jgi:hypothetical protein